jgi:Spy/CpxP family protein refolding chaperone
MKTRLKFVSLCLTLAMAVVPALNAQAQAGDAAAPGKRERGPGGPGGPGGRLEMLAQELNLTADQKAKIAPLLKHEGEQMKAVRDDQSLSQDQKKEKAKAIREEGQKAIAAVLTPEQAKKLAEMRAQGPRGDRPRGEHGKGEKPADK